MSSSSSRSQVTQLDTHYMRLALDEARKSPPRPTNFCVGACLVSPHAAPPLLATGYTLECEGNTHAEQSCFLKLAAECGCSEEELGEFLPADTTLYTTMEPCSQRSAGNLPCVERILRLRRSNGGVAIERVCVGVAEPQLFVGENDGRRKLAEAGVEFVHVPGLEEEILQVATAGHEEKEGPTEKG